MARGEVKLPDEPVRSDQTHTFLFPAAVCLLLQTHRLGTQSMVQKRISSCCLQLALEALFFFHIQLLSDWTHQEFVTQCSAPVFAMPHNRLWLKHIHIVLLLLLLLLPPRPLLSPTPLPSPSLRPPLSLSPRPPLALPPPLPPAPGELLALPVQVD